MGLMTGLKHVEGISEWALGTGCDMPFISTELVQYPQIVQDIRGRDRHSSDRWAILSFVRALSNGYMAKGQIATRKRRTATFDIGQCLPRSDC